jgi:hypothetical protein
MNEETYERIAEVLATLPEDVQETFLVSLGSRREAVDKRRKPRQQLPPARVEPTIRSTKVEWV